jgi:2-C-methyl-D-erythritol 4-phosphate cytidylyltransferase
VSVWTIVVAAGSGARFGARKQFVELRQMRVIDWSVNAALAVSDGVVVVLPDGATWDGPPVDAVVPGGDTRSASVRAGLDAVPRDVAITIVHDAARPLATVELFRAVINAVEAGADAAVPGLPVSDTLKRVDRDGTRVLETIARADLIAVQTPQAFRTDILREAHARGDEATDDAALIEGIGGTVVVVPGDPRNRKVTTPEDITVLDILMGDR